MTIPDPPSAVSSSAGKVREIRCPHCNSLLAKRNSVDQVEVRWKEFWMVAPGPALVRCRKCGAIADT